MSRPQMETVVVARCVACKATCEIRAGEVDPDDGVPFCQQCFSPMVAEKAIRRPVRSE